MQSTVSQVLVWSSMNVRIEGFRAPQKFNLSFLEISGMGIPARFAPIPARFAPWFFSTIFHDLPKLRFLAMHTGSWCRLYQPHFTTCWLPHIATRAQIAWFQDSGLRQGRVRWSWSAALHMCYPAFGPPSEALFHKLGTMINPMNLEVIRLFSDKSWHVHLFMFFRDLKLRYLFFESCYEECR